MALRWATDALYPAGPNRWNGEPTKVAPSEGEAAAGVAPGGQLPAQWLNYLLHGALEDSIHGGGAVPYTWPIVLEDDTDLNWDTWHAQRFCSVRDGNTGLPYLVGILDAGSIMRSSDMQNWTSVSDTVIFGGGALGTNMFCFAARYVCFVVTPTDGAIYSTSFIDNTNPFVLQDMTGLTGLACGAYYESGSASSGRCFLGGDTDIAYSDNMGISWTTAATPNDADIVGFVVPELGEPESEYLLALTSGAGGVVPLYSSDGGETWLASTLPPGHVSAWASGCYRASDQSYWICSSVGRVYTTKDPSSAGSWTFVADMGDASRKCTAVGRSVVMAPESYAGSVRWSGNLWVFTEDEDPVQVSAGDPTLTWGGGVFRHAGGLVAIRAREVSSNVWHAETAQSLRSPELTRLGLTSVW